MNIADTPNEKQIVVSLTCTRHAEVFHEAEVLDLVEDGGLVPAVRRLVAVGLDAPDIPESTMWGKRLSSEFETYFGPSTQGAGVKKISQIQILRHLYKKGERWI